jgi:hypothetical protein
MLTDIKLGGQEKESPNRQVKNLANINRYIYGMHIYCFWLPPRLPQLPLCSGYFLVYIIIPVNNDEVHTYS